MHSFNFVRAFVASVFLSLARLVAWFVSWFVCSLARFALRLLYTCWFVHSLIPSSFVASFSRSFVRPFESSFFRSFVCSFPRSLMFVYLLVRTFVFRRFCSLSRSHVLSLVRLLVHWLVGLFIRSLVCPLVHSFVPLVFLSLAGSPDTLYFLCIFSVILLFTCYSFSSSFIHFHSFLRSFLLRSFVRSVLCVVVWFGLVFLHP